MKKMFGTANLRNYKNPFNVCELGCRKQRKNEGIGDYVGFATLKDEKTKNVITLTRYDMSDKDLDSMDILDEVCGSIPNEHYDYLINALNNNTGLVVDWSQVDGTTSDYRIYYGLDINSDATYKDTVKKMSDISKNVKDGNISYKYSEYKNGTMTKI